MKDKATKRIEAYWRQLRTQYVDACRMRHRHKEDVRKGIILFYRPSLRWVLDHWRSAKYLFETEVPLEKQPELLKGWKLK